MFNQLDLTKAMKNETLTVELDTAEPPYTAKVFLGPFPVWEGSYKRKKKLFDKVEQVCQETLTALGNL